MTCSHFRSNLWTVAVSLVLCLFVIRVRSNEVESRGSTNNNKDNNPDDECGLFLAKSSIPNSGWGLYTGKDLNDGDIIDPMDVAIQVLDRTAHKMRREKLGRQPLPNEWNLDKYKWSADTTLASWEADAVETIIPGLGMFQKTATKVANVENIGARVRKAEDTNGAYTHFQHQTFLAVGTIPAGHELFIHHGGRSLDQEQSCKNDQDDETCTPNNLPQTVQQPLSWLREHGICVDNIEPKPSSIPSAGMGAFATRNLKQGSIVAPAPGIPLTREQLEMLWVDPDDDKIVYWEGYQLLLNYVFGHPSTSLLFYPFGPAVNLINHDHQNPNVKVQWASNYKPDIWNQSLEEVLESDADLMMEFVALRDIAAGEEILIDYGDNWQKAWDDHEPVKPAMQVSAWTLLHGNVLPTEEDGTKLPSHVQILCWVDFDDFAKVNSERYQNQLHNHYAWRETEVDSLEDAQPCHLLRHRKGEDGEIFYTAKLDLVKYGVVFVQDIPARAVFPIDKPYSSPQSMRKGFRHEMQLPDEMVSTTWQDNSPGTTTCGLYMAESAIPNSGLGMYTARKLRRNEQIFYGDLVINVEDIEVNQRLLSWFFDPNRPIKEKPWMLDSYYWNPDVAKAQYEADDIQSIVPGLGMLANSHTALVNADFIPPEVTNNLRRQTDPQAGSSTNYHNIRFLANQDVEPGSELFVAYGDSWFLERAHVLGIIPLGEDFDVADGLLSQFWKLTQGKVDPVLAKDLWELMRTPFKDDSRVKVAMPKTLQQVQQFLEEGSAGMSVNNRVRPIEWLEENGLCLDNIRPGPSTQPQAGKGAFATRFIPKGSVIAPAPVVQLHRRHMEIMMSDDFDDRYSRPWFMGKQQLLNYCYGHPDSNMLLFPYSPVINYVNHNATTFNARLQWSTIPGHQSEWLEHTPESLMLESHAGLVMEFIATRDIFEGEEIFLNYGNGWEEAYKEHVSSWEPDEEYEDYIPSSYYNNWSEWAQPSLFPLEDKTTYCLLEKFVPDEAVSDESEVTFVWEYSEGLYDSLDHGHPCDVIAMEKPDNTVIRKDSVSPTDVRYTCQLIDEQRPQRMIVRNVPRRAIEVVDPPYQSEAFLRNAFRHEIWLPEEMVPDVWRDRRKHPQE